MDVWVWAVLAVLLGIVIGLCIKIHLLRKSAQEIRDAFCDRLSTDTNTLIGISCRDRYMRELAVSINDQLRLLRSQRRRFQQGDRELKEAVTNIAHDLRTPLTSIQGYLDLLEREEKTEDAARYLALIKNRADAMTRLTEELFRYSVITSTEDSAAERVCLNTALEESLAASYGDLTHRGIVPVVSLPETPVERILDPAALGRVFENILENAVKYSDGDLSVTMERDGTIIFENSAKYLTPVAVGRLFERFYTVETARNATGLGLSIARLLTERMGGNIHAALEDGRLSVILHFPIGSAGGA